MKKLYENILMFIGKSCYIIVFISVIIISVPLMLVDILCNNTYKDDNMYNSKNY